MEHNVPLKGAFQRSLTVLVYYRTLKSGRRRIWGGRSYRSRRNIYLAFDRHYDRPSRSSLKLRYSTSSCELLEDWQRSRPFTDQISGENLSAVINLLHSSANLPQPIAAPVTYAAS